jgi:hypothetical protein
MNHLGDAYRTLSDPLNEPPPAATRGGRRQAQSSGTSLELLLAELSVGPHKERIARMIDDYNWLEGVAAERGISLS